MDTVVMDKLVWELIEHKMNEVNQIGDLEALIKQVEAKENKMHTQHKSGDIDFNDDSNNSVKCCDSGINQSRLREWKEKGPAHKK